jgi:hypothetical protein
VDSTTTSEYVVTAHVLFLGDDSVASQKVAQNLKANHCRVVSVQDLDSLEDEWLNETHHLMLVGPMWPFSQRIALLDAARAFASPLPIIMMFDTTAGEEALEAKKSGATECVILDDYEEYVSKILALVDILLKKSNLIATREHSLDRGDPLEDNPTIPDIKALAEEVRVMTESDYDVTLVVLTGADCGATLRVGRRPLLVGRDPACHLMLRDEGISRFHANFTQEGNDIVVVNDLNSKNGTFVDGKRITTAYLEKEDRVRLGSNTIITIR